MIEKAKETLRTLLDKMGIEAEIEGSEHDDHVALDIRGPDTGLVIGRKGTTLDSLQYLVNKLLPMPEGSERKPVYLDAEGYRQRRAETLTELAHRLAAKAQKSGRPVAADPMSAADRRVMHLALADMPGLTTRSEGEGSARRLVIIPEPAGQRVEPEPKDS